MMKKKSPAVVTQLKKAPSPALYILAAMLLGILTGYLIFINVPDKKDATQIAGYISIMSDIFLRLIKMLIAPLVFSTLVVGIAHMGDGKSVGRIFAKSLGWFVTASFISLGLRYSCPTSTLPCSFCVAS